ncbi:MAG: serine/threonine protein kinase [Tannerellaceae bacterium]|jgi:serine/threonine protein kinase|nr:serine/threonine protein kinase [Tannerellaceae bacterium]
MLLQENETFAGRYTLLSPLGRGGFSEVWLATDTKTGIRIALKVYAPGAGVNDTGVKIFAQEFSLVFDLNHTNLLKPSYFDTFENRPYLVLPYCEAGSIAKFIGSLAEPDAWQMLLDMASGLEYLHAQEPPVIHQDIKPDNVLISPAGRYLLTDFGISIKARNTLRQSLMKAETSIGTLAYMGPERFWKSPRPIMASDIFSFGVTMFELISGMVPFGEHGGLLLQQGAEIPLMEGDCSPELSAIVEQCLRKEPWNRPTASEIKLYAEQKLRGERPVLPRKQADLPPAADPEPPRPDNSKSNSQGKQYPPQGTKAHHTPVPGKSSTPVPGGSDGLGQHAEEALQSLQLMFRKMKERIARMSRQQPALSAGITLAVTVLLAVILSVRSANAKRQRMEAEAQARLEIERQYNEYNSLVKNGDYWVLQGDTSRTTRSRDYEIFYITAIKEYDKALAYKDAYSKLEAAGYTLANVASKKKQAQSKLNDCFFSFRLEAIKKEQPFDYLLDLYGAAVYYRRADRIRPDSAFINGFLLRHPNLPDSIIKAIDSIK